MVVSPALLLLGALQTQHIQSKPSSTAECAVMAVVAREHYGFDQRVSPPLRASGNYLPECPWEDLGVKIGMSHPNRQAKLVFSRPRVDGNEAIVDSLVIYGPLSGAGWNCYLSKARGSWMLKSCGRTRAL